MDTPSLLHFSSDDYENVYEPAEDSFLMLDALEKDLEYIKSKRPLVIVEIGSGSGVTITALAKALQLQHSNIFCFATDINFKACDLTQRTAIENHTYVESINMDLLTSFRSNLFDIVIFNPPYVVTDSCEISGCGIERSWAGGIRGREVTDRLLNTIKDMLTSDGVLYLVTIEENDPMDICRVMEGNGFEWSLIIERRIRGEYLKIFRFSIKVCA